MEVLDASNTQDEKGKAQQEQETTRLNSVPSSPGLSSAISRTPESDAKPASLYVSNWTDDEKCRRRNERMRFDNAQLTERYSSTPLNLFHRAEFSLSLVFRPYFEALIRSLDCTESDQQCFYALSVLLTMTMNPCKAFRIDLIPH